MNPNIFRSYDIRGIYGSDIDEEVFQNIGNAFARHSKKEIVISRDARLSSKALSDSFIKGVRDAGKNVTSLGELPLPVAAFWSMTHGFDLVYVTASHLPSEWNGVKFFHTDGKGFSEEEGLHIRDFTANYKKSEVPGIVAREITETITSTYINVMASKATGSKKILIDCGNGTAGPIVKKLFEKAGFSADLLFEKPDGAFPNRMSDPKEDPLHEMMKRVGSYDFGIAYDGDADRMVIITKNGKKLTPEQTAYIIMSELPRGPIVANIECSMLIDEIAKKISAPVIRPRVGHTFLIEAVINNKAVLGLESSTHYVIPFMTTFDDALAVSLYFSYALQKSGRNIDDFLEEIPEYVFERIDFQSPDNEKFDVIKNLAALLASENPNTIDGVRISYEDSWVLIRASNTSPYIRITIEAREREKFEVLKKRFTTLVEAELVKFKN